MAGNQGPTAFQPSAFQNDAFQIGVPFVDPGPQPLHDPYNQEPDGTPGSWADFPRKASSGSVRFRRGDGISSSEAPRRASTPGVLFYKRRGGGEEQDGSDPTRD